PSSPAVLAYIVNASCVNTTVSIHEDKAAYTDPTKAAPPFRFTDAVQSLRPRPNRFWGKSSAVTHGAAEDLAQVRLRDYHALNIAQASLMRNVTYKLIGSLSGPKM